MGDNVTRPSKGLYTDCNVLDQPKLTYRYALNAVLETREGDMQVISNEEGNKAYCVTNQGTSEMYINGSVYIGDNEHVLFITGFNASIIAVLKEGEIENPIINNDNIEFLVIDTDQVLRFSMFSQFQTEFRLRKGCEKWVYFTDEYNKIRSFNRSDPESFKTNPNGDPPQGEPEWSERKFDLIKGYKSRPEFLSVEVVNGGELKSGTYNFAIQYVDENFNPTEWITVSMPVSIYKDNQAGEYDGVIGSSNPPVGETNPLYGKSPCAKSIRLTLGNLDESYPNYRVAVIEATAGDGMVSKTLMSQSFPTSDTEFVYDGNPNTFTPIDLNEVLLDKVDLGIPKHICQAEDKLLVANIDNTAKDVCSLQKYASKIKSSYVTKTVSAYDYKAKGNPKSPDTLWDSMSAMGGEVYAHGIVYVFTDDTESPAYHIPGRNAVGKDGLPVVGRVINGVTITDVAELTTAQIEQIGGRDIAEVSGADANAVVNGATLQRWRVYDTAIPDEDEEGYQLPHGKMAFWQAQNAEYPERENCDGSDHWGVDSDGFTLTGKKVRHHKFPGRNQIPHVVNDLDSYTTQKSLKVILRVNKKDPLLEISNDQTYTLSFDINLSDGSSVQSSKSGIFREIDFDPAVDQWIMVYTNPDKMVTGISNVVLTGLVHDNSDQIKLNQVTIDSPGGTVFDTYINWSITLENTIDQRYDGEVIQLIGVKFENIELPPDCKGYYFVRAERDEFNRTVLDKGYAGSTRKDDSFIAFTNITETTYPDSGGNLEIKNRDHHDTVKYIFSPLNLFRNKSPNPTFLKIERIFEKVSGSEQWSTKVAQNVDDEKGGMFDNDGFDWEGAYTIDHFTTDGAEVAEHNYAVLQNKILPPVNEDVSFVTQSGEAKSLYNCSFDNRVQFVELDRPFEIATKKATVAGAPVVQGLDYQDIYYVTLRVERDIHSDVNNIKYYKMHNNMLTYDDVNGDDSGGVEIYGYDTFISHFPLTNSMFAGATSKTRILDFVVYAVVILASAVITFFTAGGGTVVLVAAIALAVAGLSVTAVETFVKKFGSTTLGELMESILMQIPPFHKLQDDRYEAVMERATGMFVESEINIGLRETPNYGCSGFMKSDTVSAAENYMIDKFIYYESGSDLHRLKPIPCPEIYIANKDFSRMNKEKVYFALASTYDCCSDCRENFPNRIYYSQKSFSEELVDSFGRFLPLDYIDIPGEYGEITDIFMEKSSLYVRTEGAVWLLPQNVQERVQGDVVSLIGTGGFFAISPKKLFDTKTGAGGGYQKFATMKTLFGTVFVDESLGNMYLLSFSSQAGTDMEELTSPKYGMDKWMKQNLKMFLSEQLRKKLKYQFPHDYKPASPFGIGMHTAYDSEYNRLLVTKIDYVLKDEVFELNEFGNMGIGFVNYETDELINITVGPYIDNLPLVGTIAINLYNGTFWKYVDTYGQGGHIVILVNIRFTDTDYFIDKSFTMSFSFSTMSWVSWHSYTPKKYIFDNNNLYSTYMSKVLPLNPGSDYFYTAKLYKHNIPDLYQTFYELAYKFIIEYVVLKEPILDSIFENILLQTVAKKNDVEQRFVTFNKAVFFNHRQCSGVLNLIVIDETMTANYMGKSVINLPDSVIVKRKNKNWIINDFRDIRTDYSLPLFTGDLCGDVNEDSIDVEKNWTELEPFMDKFLGVRLIFDNKTDVKLFLNYIIESIRPVQG